MDFIVRDALKSIDKAYLDASGDSELEMVDYKPQIKVVGCGGAGNNTITTLFDIGIEGAETIAINTDYQHLKITRADKKILVGKSQTRGLGAGGDPEKAKRAAESAKNNLKEEFSDADLVFITAGMGGGSGTGIAPIVAEVAKESGAIVVGMVSTPFYVERKRVGIAEDGIKDMKKSSHTVIVLDNERLLSIVPHLPLEDAFAVMDRLMAETIKGITETITQPSLINLDYADVKSVMSCSNSSEGVTATLMVGEASGSDKAQDVVKY
ncbi:MAG: cell division protein FtsZ, partial [Methermicoccaceae archaeon]